jgi:alpha-beta hydrolase superfamily lysophospholipase
LVIPQDWIIPLLKDSDGPPISALLFVGWGSSNKQALTKDLDKTWYVIKTFLSDDNALIAFSPRALRSLVNAPTITLPQKLPVLLLKSENDITPANKHLEGFLLKHPSANKVVVLKGAPHIVLSDPQYVDIALSEIKQWMTEVEDPA